MEIEKIHFTRDITVSQLRAARAALKLTLKELSSIANLRVGTIQKLEVGNIWEHPQHCSILTIAKVRAAYEQLGIEFYKNNLIKIPEK